jgi:hypothetical protein
MSFAHSLQALGPFSTAAEVREFVPNTPELATNALAPGALPLSGSSQSLLDPTIAVQLCGQTQAKVMGYGWETGRAAGGMLGIPWHVLQAHSATLLVAGTAGSGTLEVWHVDPVSDELRLASGYFGIWDDFRRISASTHFTKGSGLPGRVWESRQPILFQDLTESGTFLRAVAARAIGLEFGLGLPVEYPDGFGVAVLLSTRTAPIARSIDIWRLHGKSDLEHLHGTSLHESPEMTHSSRGASQSLALAAALTFRPLAIDFAAVHRAGQSATTAAFGWAWPSRDATGVVHVATVVN